MPQYEILLQPITYLKGVGPLRAEVLQKELGIFTYGDLLFHFPFRYYDRTKFYNIRDVNENSQFIQLKGVLEDVDVAGDKRSRRMVATLRDNSGSIQLVWFKGINWVEKTLKEGREYIVFGKPTMFNNKFNIAHPEMELVDNETKVSFSGKQQPFYPSTEKLKLKGLDSIGIARIVQALMQQLTEHDIEETLPENILQQYRFPSRYKALQQIHLPSSEYDLAIATQRLKYEELFFIQLNILKLKQNRQQTQKGIIFKQLGNLFNTFYNEYLPFKLTNAQKKVLKEIRQDTLSGKQMNRLLQGDVGSGKTIVALICALIANDNECQAALMVPTEILARQHLQSLKEFTAKLDFRIELLTGSVKAKERKKLFEDLKSGEIKLLIGTHALIEDTVMFKHLGMVIIDEQHRFGVAQRASLWTKNDIAPPHILVMTATPIPRTLAMTLYGDLDVSVIDELPPDRKPIQTIHRTDAARLSVFGFMKDQIKKGRQVYVVYPLIDESEKLDYKDLMDGYESICRAFPLPEYAVSIVHGKMKPEAKDFEMQRFVRGETQIMVATTVIEVGVNIPNASVMIVESAERFGLSQLHQLRGRVGRGAEQSFCILITDVKTSGESRKRMETMVRTNDGFEIAEVDLEMRGPGDLQGTQQSGVIDLRIADLAKDQKILIAARETAEKILATDPFLTSNENQSIAKYLERKRKGDSNVWSKIS